MPAAPYNAWEDGMNNFATKKAISVSLKPWDICKQFPPKKKHKHKFKLHQYQLFLLENLHLQQLLPAVKKEDAAIDCFCDQVFSESAGMWETPFPELGMDPLTPVSLLYPVS